MFKRMLTVQWQWSRLSVLLLIVFAVFMPVWVGSSVHLREPGAAWSKLADTIQLSATGLQMFVWVAGFLLAMHAWRTDQAGHHVYALSLPIARPQFVLYRYAIGALFAALIVAAFWITAFIVTRTGDVPQGLHAYPGGLALRLAVALLTTYALFFALWSMTPRAGYYTAAALILFLALMAISARPELRPLRNAIEAAYTGSGLADIFRSRWYLIDV